GELFKDRRIDPQRPAWPLRELAIAEHRQACQRKSLGAGDGLAADRIAISPAWPGAGIQQHADDGEIECRAGLLRRRWPCHRLIDLVPVVEAVDIEMPPPRMEWNVEEG